MEFSDMSMSMPAEMDTDDVGTDTECLETFLLEHGEHSPEYDHEKCLLLHQILKFLNKYHHHDKSSGKSGKSGGISSTSGSGDWEWHDPPPSTSGKSGKSGSKNGGSGDHDYLRKKLEYLIEYKCNKETTTTTVSHLIYYALLLLCDMM